MGIKRSTKLQISKSTPKGDISFLKNPFSRTTTNGSFGLQSCFPVFVTSQIVNPAYGNLNGWGGGGRRLVELCTFQNRNPVRVFLYHCISEGNRLFSENFGCHFHFILHVMSDKAAFVSRALLCVQCYRGNLDLSRSNSASRWQRINLHIYAATNSVVCGRVLRGTVFLNPHPPAPAEFLTRTARSRNLLVPLPPAPAMSVSSPARSRGLSLRACEKCTQIRSD